MFDTLPRIPLATLPTPVEFLPRLSRALSGPRLFIKRDDLTGLAGGGNKTRKLEFLTADALAKKADTLVTLGGAQSNHCRQTAAAAAKTGLRCILVLRGDAPAEYAGNVLLNHLLGAEMLWSGARSREEVMDEVVATERAAGRSPYPVPLGGSTPLGAAAYVLAMQELVGQTGESFDRVIFASSSGGTHAGLAAGAQLTGFRGEVLGISIDEKLASLQGLVADIATGVTRLLGCPHNFTPGDIHANADYLGGGYAVMGTPEREAIDLFARCEGILLDPVYTGRAAAGMIDLIRKGVIRKGESILFWHTGGTPALWAYARQLAL
ncbi:MAG TPA: D-cysteine desulfhydrase family protein [Acidobacteriota bacterium]|nr:D-cysteine desulfhydrase family protein [Acidobacteriota bacterium]